MHTPSNADHDWHDQVREAFYAALACGWSVIPLRPREKKAAIRWKGYQTQKANKNIVDSWLGQWPDANLGVVTGAISGIVVLDVDGLEGLLSVSKLGALPKTPRLRTGRGVHYYFLHPGYPVRNFAGELRGVDFRGDGGYVVGAGSIHPDGSTYDWMLSPEDTPLLPMPAWLLELVTGDHEDDEEEAEAPRMPQDGRDDTEGLDIPVKVKSPQDDGRGWALAALRNESAKMQAAIEGTKHDQRLRSAIALGGLIPAISEQEIFTALYVNLGPGAEDKRSARDTIRDGIKYGAARPREIPELPEPARLHMREKEPKKRASLQLVKSDGGGAGEPDILLNAPLSDTGNAECYEHLYSDQFRYDHKRKKWLLWGGARWEVDEEGTAERAAIDVIRERKIAALSIVDSEKQRKVLNWLIGAENAPKQKGLLTQAGVLETFATTIMRFDTDLWETGTSNGLINLRTGDFSEPAREHLITMLLGTRFEPGADCPRWRRFLSEVFADDAELIGFIQRAVGYSLTGDTSEQKMFLCYGQGSNGKGTFLETLALLLGDYAATASFSTFEADKRSEATNDLAALKGKRLVTAIETNEDRRLDEARVKAVTGEDRITCRFLYSEPFTYIPTYKLWLAMNHKPIIRGTDYGIWRRIMLIPFNQIFEVGKDKSLKADLRAELPGILNWAIEGLNNWRETGLGSAEIIRTATEAYRKESDIIGQWFDDMAASAPGERVAASDTYDSVRNWCRSYGFHEPTQNALGRWMEEHGYQKVRTPAKRFYEGLKLKIIFTEE